LFGTKGYERATGYIIDQSLAKRMAMVISAMNSEKTSADQDSRHSFFQQETVDSMNWIVSSPSSLEETAPIW